MDISAAKAAPGVLADGECRERPVKLDKGKMNVAAKLLGGPTIEHYHQADRAWWSPKRSNRPAPLRATDPR
jgi:hypothetical protein